MLVCDYRRRDHRGEPSAPRACSAGSQTRWSAPARRLRPPRRSRTPRRPRSPSSPTARRRWPSRTATRCTDDSYVCSTGPRCPTPVASTPSAATSPSERALTRDRERIWNLSPVVKVVIGRRRPHPGRQPVLDAAAGLERGGDGRPQHPGLRRSGRTRGPSSPRGWAPDRRAQSLRESRARLRRPRRHAPPHRLDHRAGWRAPSTPSAATSPPRREAAEALAQTEEALAPVAEDGGGRPADRRHRARFQQSAAGHHRQPRDRAAPHRAGAHRASSTASSPARPPPANRAAALTHRLLAFSRRQPLDPAPGPRQSADRLDGGPAPPHHRRADRRWSWCWPAGLWPTLCDPNQLENAILNLAINARDAMPDGGQLTIETCNAHLDDAYAAQAARRDARPVCLHLRHRHRHRHGAGRRSPRPSSPFFTTKPIGQGTGLGLSMIYGFARQSEGYAKIYSEVGQGTTFKLYLPRHRGEVDGDEELPAPGRGATRPTRARSCWSSRTSRSCAG